MPPTRATLIGVPGMSPSWSIPTWNRAGPRRPEQNYDNRPWSAPERHARRILIVHIGERYSLLDVGPDQVDNPAGGAVTGWVYLLQD